MVSSVIYYKTYVRFLLKFFPCRKMLVCHSIRLFTAVSCGALMMCFYIPCLVWTDHVIRGPPSLTYLCRRAYGIGSLWSKLHHVLALSRLRGQLWKLVICVKAIAFLNWGATLFKRPTRIFLCNSTISCLFFQFLMPPLPFD